MEGKIKLSIGSNPHIKKNKTYRAERGLKFKNKSIN